MKELQIFENPEFGSIRTLEINGEPYFLGKDVAEILGYTNTAKAIRDHVDDEDKLTERIVLSGQNREVVFINESGLYSLILSSKLSTAKQFKRWVTSEVLPTLRKTGTYSTPKADETLKMQIQQKRAEAMWLNAQYRMLKFLVDKPEIQKLSPVSVETLGIKATEAITGANLGEYLPQVEKTYSATEVGNAFGVSAQKIGSLANIHGLKTNEYGIFVLDKSKYSSKQVETFRYNEKGKAKIKELLGK